MTAAQGPLSWHQRGLASLVSLYWAIIPVVSHLSHRSPFFWQFILLVVDILSVIFPSINLRNPLCGHANEWAADTDTLIE